MMIRKKTFKTRKMKEKMKEKGKKTIKKNIDKMINLPQFIIHFQ